MSKSNYLEAKQLDHTLGGTAFTQPAAIYVKLHIGDPGEDCTANAATETSRKVVTFAAAVSPGGTKASNIQVQWTNYATISGGTETLTHASTWDASSGGNPLYYGPMVTPQAVTTGATFTIPSGSLICTED